MNDRASVDVAALFGPWVEWRQEEGRNGRHLITAVNHRDGQGIYIDRADLCTTSPRYVAVHDELADGCFLADAGGARNVADGPVAPVGAGLVWKGADRFVRSVHDGGGHLLFREGWVAAQIAVGVAGVVAIARTITTGAVQVHARPAQIPAIILLGLVAVAIHELGHAIATVHYGRHVRLAGLRLHLGSPAFYVESLDALLLTRRQRLVQAAAGPWAEWLITSVVALVFLCLSPDGSTAAILQRFVALNTVVIASNLLPFVGLDGALLFADAVGRPDLPFRTRIGFVRSAPREPWIVVYTALNGLVAMGLLVVAGYFWWQLFGELTSSLWTSGPAGITALAAFCFLGCRQLSSRLGPVTGAVRSHTRWIWSKLVFRSERRWRVEAIHAFRSLPEIGALAPADLGVIAGRLQRCCGSDVTLRTASSHFYVRNGPPLPGCSRSIIRPRTVVAADNATRLALTAEHDVIALPAGWQTYLAA